LAVIPAESAAAIRTTSLHLLTPLPPAPREDSLRGTQVDGAVHLDANGRPKADRDLRRLFDYFLARTGEHTPEQIRADLLAYLRDVLALDAAAQAQLLAWYDAYLDTGRAAAALSRSGNLADDLARLHALHRERLGEALAQTWFGEEDDYADHTAQRLAIGHDDSLSPAQREEKLAQLDQSLEPAQRESLHASTDFQLAVAQSEQFTADHADASTRHAERAALWGEDAAKRLDALDQANRDWQQRLAVYTSGCNAVVNDAALPTASRELRLQALLSGFGDAERRRVLSLAHCPQD
jgi:lipase chaperone LimK